MKAKKPQRTDAEKIAEASASPLAQGITALSGTLGTLADKTGELMDPVRRVCYPPLQALHTHAHKHALIVTDPIHRICYEPLKGHWETKYKARYPQHARKLFALDFGLLFVIAALIVAGMFLQYFLPTADPAVLSVTVRAPESAVSGVSTDVLISYENLSLTSLPCTMLEVDVPQELVAAEIALIANILGDATDPSCPVTNASPTPIGIPLPPMPPHAVRQVVLTGIPLAPAGSVINVPARISYWTVGGTEPTVVPFHMRIPVGSTAASVEIAVPDTILRGASTSITLSYKNDTQRALHDVAVRFAPPADFVTTGSIPRATSRNLWHIGDLAADDVGTITVYGYLRSIRDRVSSASFGAELLVGGIDPHGRDDVLTFTPVVASAARVNADSLSTGLTLTQDFGGSADARFLRPGDEVTVRLTVRNDGERTFEDAEVDLAITDVLFETDADMPTTWNAATLPSLGRIAPGDVLSVTSAFTVRSLITPALLAELNGTATASFAATLSATRVDEANGDAEHIIVDTPPRDIPVATALSLQATGVYFTKDGDQLGRGPLPPVIGETTRYRVVVQIDNAQNVVDGAVFEATLPESVEWTGKFSISAGEAVDYFPSTRRIVWKIPSIPAFTQEASRSPSASFEVALTPLNKAVGTIPVLLRDLSVMGRDAVTDVRVTTTHADISARLPFDFDDTRSVVVPVTKN